MASRYSAYSLDLSDAQMEKLSTGGNIRMEAKQLMGGDDTLMLTNSQIKKIEKAKAAGKGCELQLSATQLRYQVKVGEGRFTDFLRSAGNKIWSGAKKAGKFIQQNYGSQIKDLTNQHVGQVIDKAAGVADQKIQQGVSRIPGGFGSLLGSIVHDAIEIGRNKSKEEIDRYLEHLRTYGGSGLVQEMYGDGLFDFLGKDVGGFLNNLGNTALGVAMPIATGVLTGKLTKVLGGGLQVAGTQPFTHYTYPHLDRYGQGLKPPGY
jgi:hypothetical protein